MASLRVALVTALVLSAAGLSFDAAAAKNRPVSKVITLLKDMLAQMEKEAEEDEAVYDTMACWCETNDKEKTKAIADAEAKIKDLTTTIEELTATSAQLATEIKTLEGEVAGEQQALDKATAMRMKDLGEFNGEEKDALEAISALKAAITVLEKHNPALIQSNHILSVAATLQYQMSKHSDLLEGVLTHKQQRAVAAFVQQPQDYFDAEPTFKQAYAPQSGVIFGILKQMKETFESNLSASQKEELNGAASYEDLKAAKETEIAAGQEQIEKKTQELADTDEKIATSKQDLEDTEAQLEADQKFLAMLKEKCAAMDAEWEERQKTRQLEMEACSKALAILSSDDAHDLFTSTFNFVQKEAKANERQMRASKLLQKVAQKFHSPRLSALAVQVRLDAFTEVKKLIDDMIAMLNQEMADEVKHKDFCIKEFNSNQLSTEDRERTKAELEAKIEDLTMTIKKLTEEIDALKASIAEMQTQMKRAGEDREKENKEFQLTVADQRATQKLLQAALQVLKGFYDKKAAAAALLQKQEPFAPPPGFTDYKKNAAAGGVMGMIQNIIDEAKAMEAEAIRGEDDAQTAYEDFVKETNACIAESQKEIINKTEAKAKAEAEKTEADENLEATNQELAGLNDENQQLHKACDFVVKNFEIRQTARGEEIEALKQAKAILSGAKFQALLQEQ